MSQTSGIRKPNLDLPSQIVYLRDERGISFDLVSEENAARYLEECSYLFRVKAFARNFDTYTSGDRAGMYVGLDFGHLIELAELDDALRALVLSLALEIELAMKTRINAAAMRIGLDAYDLCDLFLATVSDAITAEQVDLYSQEKAEAGIAEAIGLLTAAGNDPSSAVRAANEAVAVLSAVTLGRNPTHISDSFSAMKASPYSSGLVARYTPGDMPYWVLMNLVSFGPLIKLYRMCFRSGGPLSDDREEKTYRRVTRILRRVQIMRNSAAHGDLLLHTLSVKESGSSLSSVRKALVEYPFTAEEIAPVSHRYAPLDTAATLICFDAIVADEAKRAKAAEDLRSVRKRFSRHAEWFEKNYAIATFLAFSDRLFSVFEDVLSNG